MNDALSGSEFVTQRRTARRILCRCVDSLLAALYAILETLRPLVALGLGAITLAFLSLALLDAVAFHAPHFPMAFVLTSAAIAVGGIVLYNTFIGWLSARNP